ncbi:MAG: hypothetical protein AAF439_07275 [Pseudomonadota bacterium]
MYIAGMRVTEIDDQKKQEEEEKDYGYSVDEQRLARWVGLISILLPVVLWISTKSIWPLPVNCQFDSISHFYYSHFTGDIFVGSLCFIGVFMIVYTGSTSFQYYASLVGGIGAICVGLFPTSGNGCEQGSTPIRLLGDMSYTDGNDLVITADANDPTLFDLFEIGTIFGLKIGSDTLHFAGAALLFVVLGVFCLGAFTAVKDRHYLPQTEAENSSNAKRKLKPAKLKRNVIYVACGLVIFGCIAALAYNALFNEGLETDAWNAGNWTFVVETIGIVAFGIAWMVRGRFFLADDALAANIRQVA